ncbi:MAG TPA: hypothetical protein VNG52_00065, partial [Stellaceae bacterium]|nr:hypothetical protein [Stellaceae bacterium]
VVGRRLLDEHDARCQQQANDLENKFHAQISGSASLVNAVVATVNNRFGPAAMGDSGVCVIGGVAMQLGNLRWCHSAT